MTSADRLRVIRIGLLSLAIGASVALWYLSSVPPPITMVLSAGTPDYTIQDLKSQATGSTS